MTTLGIVLQGLITKETHHPLFCQRLQLEDVPTARDAHDAHNGHNPHNAHDARDAPDAHGVTF